MIYPLYRNFVFFLQLYDILAFQNKIGGNVRLEWKSLLCIVSLCGGLLTLHHAFHASCCVSFTGNAHASRSHRDEAMIGTFHTKN